MRSENRNNNEINENNIEEGLLEEEIYYIKDKELYLAVKNNVTIYHFLHKILLYIGVGLLFLIDMYIIAYFISDDELLKEQYAEQVTLNFIISMTLFMFSLLFYYLYKRTISINSKFF